MIKVGFEPVFRILKIWIRINVPSDIHKDKNVKANVWIIIIYNFYVYVPTNKKVKLLFFK